MKYFQNQQTWHQSNTNGGSSNYRCKNKATENEPYTEQTLTNTEPPNPTIDITALLQKMYQQANRNCRIISILR